MPPAQFPQPPPAQQPGPTAGADGQPGDQTAAEGALGNFSFQNIFAPNSLTGMAGV
jgi:hypothetical protein